MKRSIFSYRLFVFAVFLLGFTMSGVALGGTYSDNFSGHSAQLSWKVLGSACLTAGNGTGSIPACSSPHDSVGSGALRLTPAENYQTGAILSNFNFALAQGLQVTFTTYTYGGDSGGAARDGADGITFFLTDGSKPVPQDTGASGGSMGYSCSNANPKYQGLANAYLGLGIDEYGNFLNSDDNTNTGIVNTNYSGDTSHGTNSYTNGGNEYQPLRIGLRGAGNTNWAWLHAQNPDYYSGSTPNESKAKEACKSGTYVSGSHEEKDCSTWHHKTYCNTKTVLDYSAIPYNYRAIPGGYSVLDDDHPIANEDTSHRSHAWPITYKLQISPQGLLNFSYSYDNGVFQPVLVNHKITDDNGPLPPSFRFGFSAGTGGSNNVHEITCFQASPLESNSSASANTVQSGQVQIGTQVYLASYTSDNWWGSLISAPVVVQNGTLSVSSVANWDASCVLTGGPCSSMGTDSSGVPLHNITAQSPSDRTLFTSQANVPNTGVGFQWGNLSSAQQSSLNSDDSKGEERLAWLRGDRTNEQLVNSDGDRRFRNGVLGDIIDSSPTWVGAPVAGAYPDAYEDALYPSAQAPENETGAQSYSSFVQASAGREDVVYVGSNDGWLHGFDAGSHGNDGSYVDTNNNGRELLGYMPAHELATDIVDLTNPDYSHQFYEDASPGVGDVFYGGKWHTWLVSGVGTAGHEIFALDITDPSKFSESNASDLVMGDWTSDNANLSHLADTTGKPIIIRTHLGKWAIVFGNGVNGSDSAGVYVGLVDPTTGAITFHFLDTGVGSSSDKNGISGVTSADLDGDGIADYLYAGDTQGHLWRWDITSNDMSKWKRSLVFHAYADGHNQPITVAPVVAVVNTGGTTGVDVPIHRVMVLFGTGRKKPISKDSGAVYADNTQTFYGLWDWNLSDWNAKAGADSQYASLSDTDNMDRSHLLAQTVVETSQTTDGGSVTGYRTLSTTHKVCWAGTQSCSDNNNQMGWYFDFPTEQEQDIYNPIVVGSAVVVNTAIPPQVSARACNPGLQTGWTMAFNVATGGGVPEGFFPDGSNQYGDSGDTSTVSGTSASAVGTATVVTYNDQTYIVNQTVNGTPVVSNVNPSNSVKSARVSWTELR